MKYQLKINAKAFIVEIGEMKNGAVEVAVNGRSYEVMIENSTALPHSSAAARSIHSPEPATETPAARPASAPASGAVVAPIPGLILEIKVRVGEPVTAGRIVAVMEAMKMENNLTAPVSGTVNEIRVQKGSEVSTGEIIMCIG